MRKRRNFNELKGLIQYLYGKAKDKYLKGILRASLRQADYLHKMKRYKKALDLLESAYNFYHSYPYED